MRAPRFSIAGLIGFIAVIACGSAALRSATVLWTALATTVALGTILASVLGALFLRGPERGFAAGFALFGAVYLILVNWTWVGEQVGYDLTAGLADLADRVHPPDPNLPSAPRRASNRLGAIDASRAAAPAPDYLKARERDIRVGNFIQIGRLTLDLGFALVGGLVGRALAAAGSAGLQSRDAPDPGGREPAPR